MLLILRTWRSFSLNHEVRHETKITAVFRDALINAYTAAGRKWFVTLEDPITDPDYGTELGRNDLRFFPPNHHGQTIFFTVECKRLRVPRENGVNNLADKYVEQGIQRFVDKQYSSGLPCGGMIGYVIDNEIAQAFEAVHVAIMSGRKKLKISAEGICRPSAALPEYEWSADTHHGSGRTRFSLHHALFGVIR
jgi:hypothetical protein